jgi:hypothetical protein
MVIFGRNGTVDSRQSSSLAASRFAVRTDTYLLVCCLYRLENVRIILSRIELIASGQHSSVCLRLFRMLSVGKTVR